MAKKELIGIIILFVILAMQISIAESDTITVSVEQLTKDVSAGGEAEFKVSIFNDGTREDIYSVKYDSLAVYPFSDFARDIIVSPNQIRVNAGGSSSTLLKIRVLDSAVSNINHVLKMKAVSLTNTNNFKEFEVSTFVLSPKDLIQIEPIVPSSVIPGKNIPFKIYFQNKGNVFLENVDVYLASEIFNDAKVLSFFPYGNLSEDFILSLDPTTEPGKYPLTIRIYKGQDLIGVSSTQLEIEVNPDIKEKTDVEKGFLVTKTIIVKTNEGNSAIGKKVEVPIGFFKKIFTRTSPEATEVKKEGVTYLTWEFNVNPRESKSVEITVDFRPLFAVIAAIVLFALVMIYFLSKGVSIKKRIFRISGEGEISEMKILLQVKNRDSDDINDVKIVDLLPNLIKPSGEFGTLKPDNIQRGSMGMRLIWHLPVLGVGEERIISYKVKSGLHVVGRMLLPAAYVQYRNKKGIFVSIRSNKIVLLPKKK